MVQFIIFIIGIQKRNCKNLKKCSSNESFPSNDLFLITAFTDVFKEIFTPKISISEWSLNFLLLKVIRKSVCGYILGMLMHTTA